MDRWHSRYWWPDHCAARLAVHLAVHHAACHAVHCVARHARCCLHPAGCLRFWVVGLDLVLHPCCFRSLHLGFIGATSLVALGSGSGDGLRSGVVVGWCGLLVRGAVKESTWGCNADATGRQYMLSTNVEVKEQQNIKKNKRRGEGVHTGFASKWGGL